MNGQELRDAVAWFNRGSNVLVDGKAIDKVTFDMEKNVINISTVPSQEKKPEPQKTEVKK